MGRKLRAGLAAPTGLALAAMCGCVNVTIDATGFNRPVLLGKVTRVRGDDRGLADWREVKPVSVKFAFDNARPWRQAYPQRRHLGVFEREQGRRLLEAAAPSPQGPRRAGPLVVDRIRVGSSSLVLMILPFGPGCCMVDDAWAELVGATYQPGASDARAE